MMMLLVVTVAASGMVQPGHCAEADDPVLARWRGGDLTLSEFEATIDPHGVALRRGGAFLEKQVCKAVFQEIYVDRARAKGLGSTEAFGLEVEEWREKQLATAYLKLHLPPVTELVADTDLSRFYEKNRDRLYTSSGAADIDVLFIRCGEEPMVRSECRAKMEAAQRRVAIDVSALDDVIAEEAEISGSANGSFRDVPLNSLADELREAILHTPAGFSTSVVETPAGLFWIRVERRIDPAPMPFDLVEKHIRQVLEREAVSRWRAAEVERIRGELNLSETVSERECFAAAAKAESLDREEWFLTDERVHIRWQLADLGFFSDAEILPDDAAIAAELARPELDPKYRRFDVDLLVVPVGADRYRALEIAEAVRHALARGMAAKIIAESESPTGGVDLLSLRNVRNADLVRISRQLSERVLGSADGSWFGPLAYPKGVTLSAAVVGRETNVELEGCILFAVRRASRMPLVSEVRSDEYRSFRDEITVIDRFKEVFGERWGLEVMLNNAPDGARADTGSPNDSASDVPPGG